MVDLNKKQRIRHLTKKNKLRGDVTPRRRYWGKKVRTLSRDRTSEKECSKEGNERGRVGLTE